jgi:hypothetical protein
VLCVVELGIFTYYLAEVLWVTMGQDTKCACVL